MFSKVLIVLIAVAVSTLTVKAGELSTDYLYVQQAGNFFGPVSIDGSAIPTNNLIAHYKLNQSGAAQQDYSGSGNTGTVSGATWTTNGVEGGAFSFDGVNDYIEAADSSSLDIRGAFTMSLWVNAVRSNAVEALICKHDDENERAYNLYTEYGRITAQLSSDGTGSQLFQINSQGQHFMIGAWHHLVVTWDGTLNSGGQIYVDGMAIDDLQYQHTAFVGTNIYNSPQPLRIGAKSNGDWYFSGCLDDVRIYACALSQTEVKQLYSRTAQAYGVSNVMLSVVGTLRVDGDITATNATATNTFAGTIRASTYVGWDDNAGIFNQMKMDAGIQLSTAHASLGIDGANLGDWHLGAGSYIRSTGDGGDLELGGAGLMWGGNYMIDQGQEYINASFLTPALDPYYVSMAGGVVTGSLTVASLTALRLVPQGDIGMGTFTNSP